MHMMPATLRFVGKKQYEIDAHWALYCENYLEGFHIPYVHHALNEIVDYGHYTTETFRYSSLQTRVRRRGQNGSVGRADICFIFPNTMFNFYPWGISVNVVRPVSPSKSVVEFLTYVSDECLIDRRCGCRPSWRRDGRRSGRRECAEGNPVAVLFARPIFADTRAGNAPFSSPDRGIYERRMMAKVSIKRSKSLGPRSSSTTSFIIKRRRPRSRTSNSINCSSGSRRSRQSIRISITPDSPTQRVGGKATVTEAVHAHGAADVARQFSYSLDDLKAFTERCERLAEGRKLDYVAELKIDGLSVSLHYENGILDGRCDARRRTTGDDVTQNVKTITHDPAASEKGRSAACRGPRRGVSFAVPIRKEQRRARDAGRENVCQRPQLCVGYASDARLGGRRVAAAGYVPVRRFSRDAKNVCDALRRF